MAGVEHTMAAEVATNILGDFISYPAGNIWLEDAVYMRQHLK
jgi:hypothetical protein